ncbi:crossover junction endonuclease MUS81 isoform X2 [Brachypodium distachyon]|uniref:crossover junction endonuclease MUS81 isoform X2 n=1 Tax=Brachypodium distachyon TaxID=15368 RepID=UPI0001C720FB|nr:crossover junction endonuclease MUS81 isoform X2 [Brachypodium distachyon]|eukprot:XP_024314868.1 crossover junction endonuclease MUS81 isoform X2 [Brachypodium distachyon]
MSRVLDHGSFVSSKGPFQSPAQIYLLQEPKKLAKRIATGNKRREPEHYAPKKNSAAYVILITLYREMMRDKISMENKEIIDAAEASGLLQKATGGTGWSQIPQTLISRGLVVKKLGKKYMLTEEGKSAAHNCLSQLEMEDPSGSLMTSNGLNTCTAYRHRNSDHLSMGFSVAETPLGPPVTISRPSRPVAGQTPELVLHNAATASQELIKLTSKEQLSYNSEGSAGFNMLDKDATHVDNSILAMPPGQSNEKFLDAYEVVFILDDRENIGSRFERVVDVHSKFHLPVEMKRLPVGDAIWIARHRKHRTEYVLDFIVERKDVTDLVSSIKDSRYRDQKLRLKKCGLRKLIYLVEGDPNRLDASESIKTACFTTEILEGFDVQRTTGYSDTERRYCDLTLSIIDFYSKNFSNGANTSRACLTYDEFVNKCYDFKKITVSDIFAVQLMQVPQVTEQTALAITELYPTLLSLAQAYSMLDGDTRAQEEMLKKKSKMVNGGASRNIFKLVWGEG